MRAGGPWEKGEWTDDTALAIAVATAYEGEQFDLEASAAAMVAWMNTGPKDIGNQTLQALGYVRDGLGAIQAGEKLLRVKPDAAGNGSLMRAAPTGLIHGTASVELVQESRLLSFVTHPDPRCVEACQAFNAILSDLVHNGCPDVLEAIAAGTRVLPDANSPVGRILDNTLGKSPALHADDPIGSVLLCLERALIALRDAETFEAGLVRVIAQGGDTDTNAAVAGALLGARFGHGGIPKRWLDALRGKRALEEAYGWMASFASRVRLQILLNESMS